MTPKLQEQIKYSCGPYKGYLEYAEYDGPADLFHGEVIGTKDVITFEGRALTELRSAFVESVEDYLALCRQRREPPEKPFSGRFVARIKPELHRQISLLAEKRGTSLNALVEQLLTEGIAGETASRRTVRRGQTRPVRRTKPATRANN